MRKFTLLKNLEMNGKLYLEGEEVELDEATYEWLIKSYLEERKQILEQADAVDKLADVTKEVLETTVPKRKRVK